MYLCVIIAITEIIANQNHRLINSGEFKDSITDPTIKANPVLLSRCNSYLIKFILIFKKYFNNVNWNNIKGMNVISPYWLIQLAYSICEAESIPIT